MNKLKQVLRRIKMDNSNFLLNLISKCMYILCVCCFVYFLYQFATEGITTYWLFLLFPGLFFVLLKDFLSMFIKKVLTIYPLKVYQIISTFACTIIYFVYSYINIFVELKETYADYDVIYVILSSIGALYVFIRTISMMKGK